MGTLDELDFSRGIWAAARDGEEDRIKHLLSRGTDVSQRDNGGYTGLHYAARAGHMQVVRLLIKGHLSTTKALLDAGADPNIQDSDGATAAHKAAGERKKNVLEVILERAPGCAEIPDTRGRLPLL